MPTHDVAHTVIFQSHSVARGGGVSFETWLITVVMPMWIITRMAARSWAAVLILGRRRSARA